MCLEWLYHIGLIDETEKHYVTFLSEMPSPNKRQMLEGMFPLLVSQKDNSNFTSKDQFEWGRALLIQGLLLPIDYIDTMYSTVEVYKSWLLSPHNRPAYLKDEDLEGFLKSIILELVLLFTPRPYSDTEISSLDALEGLKSEVKPDPPPEETIPSISQKSKKGLLNLNKFNILNTHQSKPRQSVHLAGTENYNKISMTSVEKYIELLKQVLQIFTVLTRLSSGAVWGKVVIQTIVKCMMGIADFCLKQGNPNEELLPDEEYFRTIDPMWSEVGNAVAELLMRNYFEVWFRTETVDEKMWATFRARIQFWTHRPQVVDDWATAVVAFTRRSYRILYDEDPRIGTKLLTVELGYNRNIQLDLSDSYILFTLPELLNLIKYTYRLNGDSFRAAINGMATISRELLELDNTVINPNLDKKYQTYIQGPSSNTILDMIGTHFFDAVLKTSSESYKHNQGRALSCAMLCKIFTRTTQSTDKIHKHYEELFYLVLRQAFYDSSCLQSILIHGQHLLISNIHGIRAFIWEFSKGVQYILPRMAPDFVAAVNPDKLRRSSCSTVSLLLSLTYNIKDVELVEDSLKTYSTGELPERDRENSVPYPFDENRFKDIDFLAARSDDYSTPSYKSDKLFKTVNNLQDIIKNISDTVSYNFNDMSIYLNPSLISDYSAREQPDSPKSMNEIYTILLPVAFLSLSTETSETNMFVLINSLVTTSMQNQEMRKDLCSSILELLLSEVSQVKDPSERELQLIRGIRQISIVLKSGVDKYYATKTIKDLHVVFLNTLRNFTSDVCFEILTEVLDCIQWWVTQNPWLIINNDVTAFIGEVWKLSLVLDKFITPSQPLHEKKSNHRDSTDSRKSKKDSPRLSSQPSIMHDYTKNTSMTSEPSTIKPTHQFIQSVSEIKDDSSSTKNSIPENVPEPNTSKKKHSFFNSKKVQMAKKMVNEVKKIHSTAKLDSKNLLPQGDLASYQIDSASPELTKEKSNKTLYDILLELHNMEPSLIDSHLGDMEYEDMSGRILYALHNSIFEFSGTLSRAFNNADGSELTSNSKVAAKDIHSIPAEYYYFKSSKVILKVQKKSQQEYNIDIHTVFGSSTFTKLSLAGFGDGSNNGEQMNKKPVLDSNHQTTQHNLEGTTVISEHSSSVSKGKENTSCGDSASFIPIPNKSVSASKPSDKAEYFNALLSFDSLGSNDSSSTECGSHKLKEFIDQQNDSYVSQVNDLKFILDSMTNSNKNLRLDNDYKKIGSFKVTDLFEGGESHLKIAPYRIPTLVQSEVVYKLDPSHEQAHGIDSLKNFIPLLDIRIGLYLFSFDKSENSIGKSNYAKISKGLLTFSDETPNLNLKVGQQQFSCPQTLGYSLKYSSADLAINLGSNQYMFYIDNGYRSRMNIQHLILKLKNEGLTGVSKIDKIIKKVSESINYSNLTLKNFTNTENSDLLNCNSSINELVALNSLPINKMSALKVFYLVSPIKDMQDYLLEVTKVVHGSNQADSEYLLHRSGPIHNRSVIHVDYLPIFLSLSFIETQKSINRILGIQSTMFTSRSRSISELANESFSERAFIF